MKVFQKGISRIYKLDIQQAKVFEMPQPRFKELPAVKPKHPDR